MARLSEGVVSQLGEISQVASEGDSCEAAATVALPGAEPVLRSARELTVGFSGGGCLGLPWTGMGLQGQPGTGLSRGWGPCYSCGGRVPLHRPWPEGPDREQGSSPAGASRHPV